MEKNKKNNWKTATLILCILIFGIIAFNVINSQVVNIYNFDKFGVKMTKSNFDSLLKKIDVGSAVKVCDLENKKCLLVHRLE